MEYLPGGIVRANPTLPTSLQDKAQAIIELTGIDKDPGTPGMDRRPTAADQRWLRRQQVWKFAERCRQDLMTQDTTVVRGLIVANAVARGLFSIWWTVFLGDQDMRRRLREAFAGTDTGCFDTNEDLQQRTGGQV